MKMTNEYKLNSVLVTACVALVFGLAGCEEKGTAEQAGKKVDQGAVKVEQKLEQTTGKVEQKLEAVKEAVTEKTEKAGEYVNDSVISMEVKTAILNDASLKASKIEVTTENGVVKLSGTVDSEQSLSRAAEIAKSQKNVKSVQTDLVINASAPNK
jgi:hyperosmotically inducible protein